MLGDLSLCVGPQALEQRNACELLWIDLHVHALPPVAVLTQSKFLGLGVARRLDPLASTMSSQQEVACRFR